MTGRLQMRVRVGAEGPAVTLRGRDAWFLQELLKVGPRGLTTLEYPGTRISQYCMKNRRAGIHIACDDEKHDGPFKGTHGRYRLVSDVVVLDVQGATQ